MRIILLFLCAACVWASDEENANIVKEFKADEPEPLCTVDGQFLLHGASRCKYIRCTYGPEPFEDADGKIQLFAVERDCPYGTAVNRRLYREGYGSLKHSRLCTEHIEHHDGGVQHHDPCIVLYPSYTPTYPSQTYPTEHVGYPKHAAYPAQPYQEQAPYQQQVAYQEEAAYHAPETYPTPAAYPTRATYPAHATYPAQAAYPAQPAYPAPASYPAQPYLVQSYPHLSTYPAPAYPARAYPAYPPGSAYIGYPEYPTYAGVEQKMAKLLGGADAEVNPFKVVENSVKQGPNELPFQEQVVEDVKLVADEKVAEKPPVVESEVKKGRPTNHKQTVHTPATVVDETVEQPEGGARQHVVPAKKIPEDFIPDDEMEDVSDKTVELEIVEDTDVPPLNRELVYDDTEAAKDISQLDTDHEDREMLQQSEH